MDRDARRRPLTPRATMQRRALSASAALLLLGFGLGAAIDQSTTLIPAHYHATIGAVTVAYMAVALTWLLPDRPGARAARWLPLQPLFYGLGQSIFSLGFAYSGFYGLGRKVYGSEQVILDPRAKIGLAVMGLGGVFAIVAGVLFVALVGPPLLAALRRRPAGGAEFHPSRQEMCCIVGPPIRVLVTDLDNTLYDWIAYIVPCVEAMVESLVQTTGYDEADVLASLQSVYRQRGSLEYPFAIQEAPLFAEAVEADFERFNRDVLEPARRAFIAARDVHLRPFEGVEATLVRLRQAGLRVVGLTDASAAAATLRLRVSGLDRFLDRLYAIENYPLPPKGRMDETLRREILEGLHELEHLRPVTMPLSHIKPAPAGLEALLEDEGIGPDEAILVGDNLRKDVEVARRVGVRAFWAAYGGTSLEALADRLARLVPPAVTARNAPPAEAEDGADCVRLDAFAQLLDHLEL